MRKNILPQTMPVIAGFLAIFTLFAACANLLPQQTARLTLRLLVPVQDPYPDTQQNSSRLISAATTSITISLSAEGHDPIVYNQEILAPGENTMTIELNQIPVQPSWDLSVTTQTADGNLLTGSSMDNLVLEAGKINTVQLSLVPLEPLELLVDGLENPYSLAENLPNFFKADFAMPGVFYFYLYPEADAPVETPLAYDANGRPYPAFDNDPDSPTFGRLVIDQADTTLYFMVPAAQFGPAYLAQIDLAIDELLELDLFRLNGISYVATGYGFTIHSQIPIQAPSSGDFSLVMGSIGGTVSGSWITLAADKHSCSVAEQLDGWNTNLSSNTLEFSFRDTYPGINLDRTIYWPDIQCRPLVFFDNQASVAGEGSRDNPYNESDLSDFIIGNSFNAFYLFAASPIAYNLQQNDLFIRKNAWLMGGFNSSFSQKNQDPRSTRLEFTANTTASRISFDAEDAPYQSGLCTLHCKINGTTLSSGGWTFLEIGNRSPLIRNCFFEVDSFIPPNGLSSLSVIQQNNSSQAIIANNIMEVGQISLAAGSQFQLNGINILEDPGLYKPAVIGNIINPGNLHWPDGQPTIASSINGINGTVLQNGLIAHNTITAGMISGNYSESFTCERNGLLLANTFSGIITANLFVAHEQPDTTVTQKVHGFAISGNSVSQAALSRSAFSVTGNGSAMKLLDAFGNPFWRNAEAAGINTYFSQAPTSLYDAYLAPNQSNGFVSLLASQAQDYYRLGSTVPSTISQGGLDLLDPANNSLLQNFINPAGSALVNELLATDLTQRTRQNGWSLGARQH